MASVADYDVRAAFSAIEEELIASMMRNLANHRAQETAEGIQWSQWQVEQLAALERYKKRNRKRFGGLFSGINARIERAIAVQRAAGQAGQELSILQAAKTGAKIDKAAKQAALEGSFHDINDRKFNALLRATTQDMEKAEHAILRRANDAYRKVIFNAQVYANSAGTYEKAVDMATRDFLRSGIQCVVYKDGSRHSLADYADMALRTASKRAYLQGEGEQRQEWGISTVIVNKRGGACPKCARFCGKVFIDDVWSGGKAEDGDYPLLSSAIQMGLYHPRCKDAHSTFFPGVTEVDQPWTPAELEQLERTEQRQQRQQHAQRQAERYDRLARYSLDPENRKRYKNRELAWREQTPEAQVAQKAKTPSREEKVLHHEDITESWLKKETKTDPSVKDLTEYTVGGVVYKVDGKHILLDYSEKEKAIAEILSQGRGVEVYMVPRVVYPQNVSTPDYIMDGKSYDLKQISGSSKNTLYNAIAKKKKQSSNFVFDVSDCPLTEEELIVQVEGLFRSDHTRFVDEIIIIKDGEIKKIFRRKE